MWMTAFSELHMHTMLWYWLLPTVLNSLPLMVALALARVDVEFMADGMLVCNNLGVMDEGMFEFLLLGCCS